jgi:dTDP-4-amino-4,6-dideoxygalactose transaminase
MQGIWIRSGNACGAINERNAIFQSILCWPIFPELREDEQQTVVNAIAEFLS